MVFQYAVVKKAWLDIHYHARSLQNIWGFESNNQAYKKAIATYDQGEYPQPRILKQNIETFFQQTPKKFDIVYIDACGSVPSTQHALRCVSTMSKSPFKFSWSDSYEFFHARYNERICR